jgi:hypothetical protein
VVAAVPLSLSAKSGHLFPKSRNLSGAFRGGVFGILKILRITFLTNYFDKQTKIFIYVFISTMTKRKSP